MSKSNFRTEVAEEMIRQIEAGTAPWQKPWQPGVVRNAPHNPVSESNYRGINAWWLELQGHSDPRWMTYRQAARAGAQVRKGEKGTQIEYWKWKEQVPEIDDDRKQVLDEKGKPKTKTVRLTQPKVFYATVFNAEQIDGLEPYAAPEVAWESHDKAEGVMQSSGVRIKFDQADRAFYSPLDDEVSMPPAEAFKERYEYYAVALHELGHSTGHRERLAREFGPFGSATYAQEELRAEMAAYMLTTEVGLGHYPERHAAYVESWLNALRDDSNLLFRAARDAETIRTWLMEPEKRQELAKTANRRVSHEQQEEIKMNASSKSPQIFLVVPYSEKEEAKQLGARWDRKAKSWYVPASKDQEPFSKWIGQQEPKASSLTPQEEFAEALQKHGLKLEEPPVMDGRWHRVQVEDDRKNQKSGSYKGFLDGRPSGLIMNYRTGDDAQKWVATGEKLDPAELKRLRAESVERKAAQEQEINEARDKAAKRAYGIWENAPASSGDHEYLKRKEIRRGELRQDKDGNLLVPMRNVEGRLMNVQRIAPDGAKRYLKEGQKQGLSTSINGQREGTVVIAEGYATADSINQATGFMTVVAFDAGNLGNVAQQIREKDPHVNIIIAAEDDRELKKNVGMVKAKEAAELVNGVAVVPEFTKEEKEQGMTDWNDLARSRKHFQSKNPRAVQEAFYKAEVKLEEKRREQKKSTDRSITPREHKAEIRM